ncbi:peptidyl-tRNA hydrolase Pth2 [Candidatus Nanohalococcus occultus]|uniref:peptidyl-tRNA hydrolase Pth2 n=1 Tax=Candidatus Nanohalococcus occultus TaxID=2978047 RepID=UPI0039E1803B
MTAYKQAIVLREDIEMSTGKMIAQACHASLKAYKRTDSSISDAWESAGAKKIALKSEDIESLERKAKRNNISAAAVRDAGMTEVPPNTLTAVGIGPAEEAKIDTVTGELELIN